MTVSANVRGGSGGSAVLGTNGTGGNGASLNLTNAIDGNSTGAGGFMSGTAGAATSSLTRTKTGLGSVSELTINTSANGGSGGDPPRSILADRLPAHAPSRSLFLPLSS